MVSTLIALNSRYTEKFVNIDKHIYKYLKESIVVGNIVTIVNSSKLYGEKCVTCNIYTGSAINNGYI